MSVTLKRPSPIGLLLLSIISVQFGSALAKSLFSELGPWGVVALRVSFSAIFLFSAWRLKWNSKVQENIRSIIAFGLIMATMNMLFYLAIDRIPLGVAITLEFIGPARTRHSKIPALARLTLGCARHSRHLATRTRRQLQSRPHRHGPRPFCRTVLGLLHLTSR